MAPPQRGIWLVAGGATFAVAVFVGDLRLPLGYSLSLLYVLVVLLGLGLSATGFAVVAAAAGTVLTVLGFLLSPGGGNPAMGLFDRGLAVLLIWTTAALVVRHKRTDRELIEERHEAQAYLDIAAVAILVLDREGRATLINKRGCEILEREPEEVVGQPWFERFVAERYHEENLATWARMLDGEVPKDRYFENAIVTKSGQERLMAWHRTVMQDAAGRVIGTLSSGEDITERRRAEELLRRQEALAQVGQMAAVVAHQVRNPLAGIKGAIQIIGSRLPPKSPDRQVISSILDRIGALNDMTRDLLTYSRPRAPQMAVVRVHTVLRDAATLLRTNPEHSAVSVEISGQEVSIPADAELLKDVFLNLFLNAAQAIDSRGMVQVAVQADELHVDVHVRDSGPGIPSEVRDRIFEPFVTTKHQGTGLGLSIVKGQVEAHGGEISLECPPDGGTVVTVSLPKARTPR
jgi:PAS domain S-box-containing protein